MQLTSASHAMSQALPVVDSEAATLRLPVYGFVTAAAISLNLWGWIAYGVWRLAF